MRMLWGSFNLLKWSYRTSTHCLFRDKKDRWHVRLQESNFNGQSNLSAAEDLWMCCLQPHFWLWAYLLPGFPQQLAQVPSCFLLAGVCLDSIVFLKKTPGYGGFITFSDVELVSPSGTVSHQMDLYCRIQQICIFLCITNLEMILFGDVPVSGTKHMFKPTFVWVTTAQPQERRLYFFSIPCANEVFFFLKIGLWCHSTSCQKWRNLTLKPMCNSLLVSICFVLALFFPESSHQGGITMTKKGLKHQM